MGKKKERPLITFLRDTREGKSALYDFALPKEDRWTDGGVLDVALPEGDYAVEVNCVRVPVVVERKSIGDWFMVVGRERERFVEELQRLLDYEQAYVLIEASEEAVKRGYERSRVNGLAAWASAIHWEVQYGIRFRCVGNWNMGRMVCQRILEEFAWHFSQRSEP